MMLFAGQHHAHHTCVKRELWKRVVHLLHIYVLICSCCNFTLIYMSR